MNILLIQQDLGRRNRAKPIYPIGLLCLATRISPSHRVRIYDPNLLPSSAVQRELEREIEIFKPDVVGLSIKYIDTTNRLDPFVFYSTVPPLITYIKQKNPRIHMVAGGAGFSLFAGEIMNDIPLLDFGVFLEAEESFAELLDHLDAPHSVPGIFYRESGQVRFSGRRPLPAYHRGDYKKVPLLMDMAPYVRDDVQIFGIQTKRGCAFDCSYCTYPFLNGREFRLRDPMDVVDEIEFFNRDFGLSHFSFADNIFNVPLHHALAICREIIKRRLDVRWAAWCDLSEVSRDFLDVAREAGCRSMDFSPDASTQEGLHGLGKKISPEDIRRGIRLAKNEKQITFAFNFFCSHPKAGIRDVLKSFYFWIGVPLVLWKRGRVSLNWIRIYPHTAIYRIAVHEGRISRSTNLLAKTPGTLKKLFYEKPSFVVIDRILILALKAVAGVVKPVLRAFFEMKNQKYPFYYE